MREDLRHEELLAGLHAQLDEARAEIERLTFGDPVTGCLNRLGLARALGAVSPTDGTVAALLFDIDDFDGVNARLGYAAGDVLLRDLAGRARESLRPEDPLARVGGNRFLALLPGLDETAARAVAERLRLAIAWAPFAWEPAPLHLTVSVGVVELPALATSMEEALSVVQVALDRSKRRGKNRVSAPLEMSTSTNLLNPAMRPFMAAVQNGEGLVMYAQSIRKLPEEDTAGWEMLVRGPPGALARPDDLFRMAGEHHVSTALDLLCLRLAVTAAGVMARPGVYHLNLLPASLLEAPPDQLLTLLASPPPAVTWCVELSEKQFLGDPAELVDAVERLRAARILVAIDDVGSGRGTLDSVLALQPQVAKLDIRLVRGIAGDPWRRGFVARLVKMAAALGMEVVAEGVENRADLAVLLDLGVPLGQGYLWGRPERVRADD